jgi:hypothetical protein
MSLSGDSFRVGVSKLDESHSGPKSCLKSAAEFGMRVGAPGLSLVVVQVRQWS